MLFKKKHPYVPPTPLVDLRPCPVCSNELYIREDKIRVYCTQCGTRFFIGFTVTDPVAQ